MNAQTFYVAPIGQKGALVLFILFVLSVFLSFEVLAFCFFVALIAWIFMFRNPERLATHLSSNAFLAPIDGKVEEIYAEGEYSVVIIHVGILDVGVLRSPLYISSYDISCLYGVPLLFSSKKNLLSPNFSLSFANHLLKIEQNLFSFFPIEQKERFERGERMGFLKAGKIKLRIKNIELKINIGDKIKGGESVIGYLNEN